MRNWRLLMELHGLTTEQCKALEAMEKAFGIGPDECFLHNVKDRDMVYEKYGYSHWIKRSAREMLISYGQLKYALTLEDDRRVY
jgi:hypothetical protein